MREGSIGSSRPRVFAVAPAAGLSRRMGTPKLVLPLGGKSVLHHVTAVLSSVSLDSIVVVVGPDAANSANDIAPGCHILRLEQPTPDMKATVREGLAYLRQRHAPRPIDAWMLALGDHPSISPAIARELAAAHAVDPTRIRLPTHEGRRGHPVLFPWPLADELDRLTADQGVNALLQRFPKLVTPLPTNDPRVLEDLDEPADYERLRRRSW